MNDATGIQVSQDPPAVSASGRLHRYFVPAAVVLGAAGQFALLRADPARPDAGLLRTAGGLLLLLACIAFGLGAPAWPWSAWPDRTNDAARPIDGIFPTWQPVLMVSLAAAGAGIAIFAFLGESPVVAALWLAGMLLLLLAQAPGMAFARLRSVRIRWSYVLAVAALLLITVVSRAWHLTTLPLNFDGDFASVGLEARAAATGQAPHIFEFRWASIPLLGYLPSWLSMLVFGTGLLGLNAAGVIQGTLVVLGVFLIGRELFSRRVGLLAAALLVVSYTHMAVSRQAAYIDPVFAMTWAVYFLLMGLRARRGWAVVLAGFATALCVEVYYSGRIIVPLIGLALVYALIFRRQWLFARWKGLLLFGLAFVIALGPMLVLFIRYPEATMSRTEEVFILGAEVLRHMKGVYGVETVAGVLEQQALRTALLFNYYPDKGTQFALTRPFLDPFTGVLFALGLGCVVAAFRRAGSWLLLWWILLVMVVGSLLTVNAPFWPRLMVLLPPAALIAALALDVLYGWLDGALRHAGRVALVAPVITALALGVVGVSNWNAYVQDKGSFATGRTRIARYLADQPSTARAYLLSSGYNFRDREFEFLIPGRLVASITPDQAEQPLPPAGAPTLLIVTPDVGDLAQQLAARYPGGPVAGNSPGEVAFYVFQLP